MFFVSFGVYLYLFVFICIYLCLFVFICQVRKTESVFGDKKSEAGTKQRHFNSYFFGFFENGRARRRLDLHQ